MQEKASERVARLLREVAGATTDDQRRQQIMRAARRLKWNESRVKHLWYREAVATAAELIQIEDYLRLREARNEYQQLRDRIARIEAAMGIQDPEFAGPHIDALQHATSGARRARGPMDR